MSTEATNQPPAATSAAASQAKSTGVVSIAILCSRLLGLVRDRLLGNLFGSSWGGLFIVAFRTPNMLRDLFAEGALSTAFVTTFSKKIKTEGDEAAWQLGRKMATLSAVFMTGLSIAGILLAPFIIRWLNPGWKLEDGTPNLENYRIATNLAQVMYPFIAIVSLTALVMGMLNAKRIFFVPSVASAFFNLGSICGGLGLAWWFDPGFPMHLSEKGLVCFAAGTLIGGLCQLVVQLPSLRKVGFRFRPDFQWNDPGVKEVLRLMWPSLIAAGGTQVNVFLNTIFASYTPGHEQAALWLGNAQRLMQLPLGLFGVATATVTLPALARAATNGINAEFRGILASGLRQVIFLALPSAIGLAVLAYPIVSLIYEGGRFHAADTLATAAALQAFAFGLVFYSGIKIVQPAFYAIDKRFLPMFVSIVSIVVNLVLNYTTVFILHLGHTALAWGTGIGLCINFIILYFAMRKYAAGLEDGRLLATLGKLAVAVAALGAVCWASSHAFMPHWTDHRFPMKMLLVFGTIALGGAAYFGSCMALKVPEAAAFASILRRRLGK